MADRVYCYPNSDVLKNKMGIRDIEKLRQMERRLTIKHRNQEEDHGTVWEKEGKGTGRKADGKERVYPGSRREHCYEVCVKRHSKAEVDVPGGDFLEWQIPGTGHGMVFFSSGMGDGVYSGYWGVDDRGETVCLVVPFMNTEYFLQI